MYVKVGSTLYVLVPNFIHRPSTSKTGQGEGLETRLYSTHSCKL